MADSPKHVSKGAVGPSRRRDNLQPPQSPKAVRKKRRRRIVHSICLVLLLLWAVLFIESSIVPPGKSFDLVLNGLVGGQRFDLLGWEIEALGQKTIAGLRLPALDLSDSVTSHQVQEYIDLLGQIRAIGGEIEQAYAERPAGAPATDEIREMETHLLDLRDRQGSIQLAVERIIERQVTAVASSNGLTTADIVFPPVSFRISPLPSHLVISRRDRIELLRTVDLVAGLSIAGREALEAAIDEELGVSSLVEDIGGYGTYPSMVLEEPSLIWLANVVAHEWTHNYLTFRPLGIRYDQSPAMRTINETVATIVGDELGARAIESYYPWLTPPPLSWQQPRTSGQAPTAEKEPEQTGFSYGAFMRETRLEVDRLLSSGSVLEAEAYMEARRQTLVTHGYVIRKLNQAYFAFHGLYATGPGATDPIGPKIEELRRRSASLEDFVRTVNAFRSEVDLDRSLEIGEPAG